MATIPAKRSGSRAKTPAITPPVEQEVLTTDEVAVYLRVTREEVVRLVMEAGLPGRKTSDDWRFLKSAIQSWLVQPKDSMGKAALLALAGKFANDPFLNDITEGAYRQRRLSSLVRKG